MRLYTADYCHAILICTAAETLTCTVLRTAPRICLCTQGDIDYTPLSAQQKAR